MGVPESGMPAEPLTGRRLSRRALVRLGLAVAALPILAACGEQSSAPAKPTSAPAAPAKPAEAPKPAEAAKPAAPAAPAAAPAATAAPAAAAKPAESKPAQTATGTS